MDTITFEQMVTKTAPLDAFAKHHTTRVELATFAALDSEMFVCSKNIIYTYIAEKKISAQSYSPVELREKLLELHKLEKHVIYR